MVSAAARGDQTVHKPDPARLAFLLALKSEFFSFRPASPFRSGGAISEMRQALLQGHGKSFAGPIVFEV